MKFFSKKILSKILKLPFCKDFRQLGMIYRCKNGFQEAELKMFQLLQITDNVFTASSSHDEVADSKNGLIPRLQEHHGKNALCPFFLDITLQMS